MIFTKTFNNTPTVEEFEYGHDAFIRFGQHSKAREMIHWLFGNRCVQCKHLALDVNEIIPRSRNRNSVSDWRNRVPLCKECHNEYHKDGVTDEKISVMQILRKSYLVSIGRGEFQ